MPTLTIESTADGLLRCSSAVYASARSGAGTVSVDPSGGPGTSLLSCGQSLGAQYFVYESFLEFDPTALPDNALVTSVTLKVFINATGDESDTEFIAEARLHDWGGGLVSAGDWVPGADLSGKTLLATLDTSTGITQDAFESFTAESAFLAEIDPTAVIRFLLTSNRTVAGTAPTGDENINMHGFSYANPAQLVIEYIEPDEFTLSGTIDLAISTSPADLQVGYLLGGTSELSIEATGALAGAPSLDFSVYDLYVDDGDNLYGLIKHEDAQNGSSTRANPVRADKQDVGQNPFEQRPEFGDPFAQGDFSHGAGQEYFHHVGRDEKKYLASEGFDISEPGTLRHLHEVDEAEDFAAGGATTQAGGELFLADGQTVRRGDGTFPGTWSTEDPSGVDADQNVHDLTSRGAEVFAAINTATGPVRIRSSAGTWSRFQPDGATDLSGVGIVTKIAWLKDRLIIAGDGGRGIYEVVADSTPTAIKTLPEGWTVESFFEAGAFIYAPSVNADAGLSRVHIIGLDDTAAVLEDKGAVPVPRNELLYSGIGTVGQVFLGGGRVNSDGGYDPVFYQAIQNDNGFLQLLKIAQGEGGSADCSVLAFEDLGDAIVFGWSEGSGALTGARTGLAWYHLGRQAFAHHLKLAAATTAQVVDIFFSLGRLTFSVEADGLYFEDVTTFVDEAYLISSVGDWSSAGLKVWDLLEVSHKALPSGARVAVDFTTKHPDEDDWNQAISNSTADSLGADNRLSNTISRLFAVKLRSFAVAAGTSAPEPQSFSVRSNPTRPRPEFVLSRTVRVLAKDRKDKYGPEVYHDPVARRIALQQLLSSWVNVYEPGITWTAFVLNVADVEPAEPFLSATNGEPLKEAFLVQLEMVATGAAT